MNEFERQLRNLLEQHIENTPSNSTQWDKYNDNYVKAIRGSFRLHLKKLDLPFDTGRLIMDSLGEPDEVPDKG